MSAQRFVCRLSIVVFSLAALMGCDPEGERVGDSGEPSRLESPSTPALQRQSIVGTQRVAALFADSRDPFQQAQAQYLQVLGSREVGAELHFHDALGSASRQQAELSALLASPPEALILLPVELEPISDLLIQLREAGTLVIGLDSRLASDRDETGCSSVVYEDPTALGRMAGQVIQRSLARKAEQTGASEVGGRLVQLRGDDESAFCAGIHQGLVQSLADTPGIVMVHDAPTGWSAIQAAQRTAEALRIQKQVDVLFAHSDETARSAHEACVQSGVREQMLIIGTNGFSGPDGGIEMIRNNEIDATLFRPLLVDFAWAMILRRADEPDFQPKRQYQLEARIISPADIDRLRPSDFPKWPEW